MAPTLTIIGATWGKQDCTKNIQKKVDTTKQTLSIQATNDIIGFDGLPGVAKTLVVVYKYSGFDNVLTDFVTEGNTITLNPGTDLNIKIFSATWGPKDVTELVTRILSTASSVNFTANNDTLGGDSWPGVTKVLTIAYSLSNGPVAVDSWVENSNVNNLG